MKLLKNILLSMLFSTLVIISAIIIFSLFILIAETFGGPVAIIASCFLLLTVFFIIGFYY